MEETVGYVFPIRSQHAIQIFEARKEVFVKFGLPFRKLKVGAKALFQVSGEKRLIGEAVIKSIERMTPEEAWEKYGTRLFLTREELLEYGRKTSLGKERKAKQLTVFRLGGIRKYAKPIFPKRRMTIAGYYISENEYSKLARAK